MAIASGLDSIHPGSIVSLQGAAYWGNGFDPVKVWDGYSDIRDVGITSYDATPSIAATAGGGVTPGAHAIRCRYMAGGLGHVGNPSPESDVTSSTSDEIQVTVMATAAAGVDTIIVEMTAAGGSAFYEAARQPNESGTITIGTDDTTLMENMLQWNAEGHIAPPVGAILVEYKGSLVVAGPALHTNGTVHQTASGTTLSGTSTEWKQTLEDDGWLFRADGHEEVGRIDSLISGVELTLEETYSSLASGTGYSMWSPRRNKAHVSLSLYPESFGGSTNDYREQELLQGKSDTLAALKRWFGQMIVYGEHNMERWSWEEDYTDGSINQIPGNRGAINDKTVIDVEGVLYSFDKLGFHTYAGAKPMHISNPVDSLLENVNWDESTKFHTLFSRETRQVMTFVATGNNTECTTAFCYDVDQKLWSTRLYEYGWSATAFAPDDEGYYRPLTCDENGYTWFDGIGSTDGAHPTCTTVLTCDSGSTVGTVNVLSSDTLYLDSGSGMAGVPLYFVDNDETQYATSNHASNNTLYMSANLTTAPAYGDTVHVGRILTRYKTKAFSLGGSENEQRPYYFCIDYLPTPVESNIKLRMYADFSSDPKTDYLSKDNGQPGVTQTANSPDIVIDLSHYDGHIKIPLGDSWNHHMEFEILVDNPAVAMRLMGYYVEGQIDRQETTY